MYTNERGFTIVELLTVIAVMAILIPITMFSMNGLNKQAQDRERESDATSIARQLELVYTNKLAPDGTATGTPTYPGTGAIGLTTQTKVFGGATPDITIAPGTTSFSIVKATNTSADTVNIRPIPSATSYVYQPLVYDTDSASPTYRKDKLCTTASGCGKFNLYYRNIYDNKVKMISSKRQQ
jgi:prepilin-type N-terminal cleavage/methylation domain-containing protein